MPDLYVSFGALSAAQSQWREEANRVANARDAVQDAGTTGFGSGVRGDVATFLETWSETIADVVVEAEAVASRLASAQDSYFSTDYAAMESFYRWLEAAP